jgi:S1-C subfamily serine protease
MSRFWRYFVSNGRGGQDCERLGVHGHGVPLFGSVARRLGLPQENGVEVWGVRPGSPADRAGLRPDDIILAVADQPTAGIRRLDRLLRPFPTGMRLTMAVLRDEEVVEQKVVLEDARPRAR